MEVNIRQIFLSHGFEVNDTQLEQFNRYLKLLQEWNEKMNLIASADAVEIVNRHFIDSLSLLKYHHFTSDHNVIDVGTGAGFPGIPLAIMVPSKFTLVDSLLKRINFLETVKSTLSLNHVSCVHTRFEDLAHNKSYRQKYDIAVSRAVAPLNVLLEFTMPFLKNGGILLAHKGSMVSTEIDDAQNALKMLNSRIDFVHEYVDDKNIKRYVIEISKLGDISQRYPRKAGTPKSSPLI